MFTFTIDDQRYVPRENKLYRIEQTIHTLDDIQPESVYLHRDTIGKFEKGESFSSYEWKFTPLDTNGQKRYYISSKDGRLGEEFSEPADQLNSLVPEEIHRCPDCGSWAGDKSMTLKCFQCGYEE